MSKEQPTDEVAPTPEPLSRERIVATARDHIERDGAEALSLRGVARTLGVTAPALYAYVADKHDLIAAVATQYFAELVDRFDQIDAAEPLDQIRQLSRAYITHAMASPELFRLLFRFPPSTGVASGGPDEFGPSTASFNAASAATEAAIEAGLLAVTDPVEASMTMWAAVHGVAEVLLLGFRFSDADAERLIDSVIETILAGQRCFPAPPNI